MLVASALAAPECGLATETTASACLFIDRMEPLHGHETGSLSTPLCKPPSRLVAVREKCGFAEDGRSASGLRLTAHLMPSSENPQLEPGRCAYCVMTRKGETYLDLSSRKLVTFYIRGESGGEKLQIALVDRSRESNADAAVCVPVQQGLGAGTVTTEWQKARIPLHLFHADLEAVAEVRFVFDNAAYGTAVPRRVTVYLDELAVE